MHGYSLVPSVFGARTAIICLPSSLAGVQLFDILKQIGQLRQFGLGEVSVDNRGAKPHETLTLSPALRKPLNVFYIKVMFINLWIIELP